MQDTFLGAFIGPEQTFPTVARGPVENALTMLDAARPGADIAFATLPEIAALAMRFADVELAFVAVTRGQLQFALPMRLASLDAASKRLPLA